ncbi:MAG: hypothetical protein BroJett030_16500 [Alphaproteobacteria bacterium]|nr:MAG: hypothetical protein BroJett030_16500 [Alphaproteobacteria bacterium]
MEPATANPAPGFARYPDHRITLRPFDGVVTVAWRDRPVARSRRAIQLLEADHPPVFYLPLQDVEDGLLRRSGHASHCPFKGQASYWNLALGDHEIDNAVWGYETPYDEMLELAGLVAFYTTKVTVSAAPAHR